jgi:hypothetical protein
MTADRTPYSIAGRFELPLRVRNGHPSSLLAFIHNLSTSSVFVPIAPLPPPRARWGLQQKRCRRVQRPFLSYCIILGVNSAIYDCNSLRTCAVCEASTSWLVLHIPPPLAEKSAAQPQQPHVGCCVSGVGFPGRQHGEIHERVDQRRCTAVCCKSCHDRQSAERFP